MQQDYINRIHNELLSIIKEIDKICRNYNLRYYLVGGTLLGAVRHKGFIPWDDDLDIAMPRKDFTFFVENSKKILPDNLRLLWINTSKKYWFPFAKIEKKGTLFLYQVYKNAKFKFGINIDIFPLDESYGYNKKTEKNKRIIKRVFYIKKNKIVPVFSSPFIRFVTRLIPNAFLNIAQNYVSTKQNGKSRAHYYSNYGSNYSIKKQTMPKEVFGDGIDVRFEHLTLRAPKQSNVFLTNLFGNNYMDLPPIEKRYTHLPNKVVFSDGFSMCFKDEDLNKFVDKYK